MKLCWDRVVEILLSPYRQPWPGVGRAYGRCTPEHDSGTRAFEASVGTVTLKAVLDSRGLARAAPGDGEGLCTAQCRISDTGRAPQLAGISTTDADLVAAAGHKQAKLDGLGEQFQINWPLKGFNLLYYLSGRFLHHLLTLLTFLSWLFLMQSVPHLASPKVVMVNVDSLA